MKKYTHAWLAFKAIERLESAHVAQSNQIYVNTLVAWFKAHKDGVMQGAWYPDSVIKDMASSHVLKMTPATGERTFRKLPSGHLLYDSGKDSDLHGRAFTVDRDTNLPDRCEAIAQSVIDNLKMQEIEPKGSPISPTDNHVAVLLFMLSHYIADAHMPFHCDSRRFSEGDNLHTHIEGEWDDEVQKYYDIDKDNERFFYNPGGYPLFKNQSDYNASYLRRVDDELNNRDLLITWGSGNNNVWDFMSAICEYSYLLSYDFIPDGNDETNVTKANWKRLPNQKGTFEDFSVFVIADAIDSIAKVWLRIWRRYKKWEKEQRD